MRQNIGRQKIRNIIFILLLIPLLFWKCDNNSYEKVEYSNIYFPPDSAEWVIRRSINEHGGMWTDRYVEFVFRNRLYSFKTDSGKFIYTVTYSDSFRIIKHILTNGGLRSFINDVEHVFEDEQAKAAAASLNSVIYFFMLPQRLLDMAVESEYLGKQKILNRVHYTVKIGFSKQGGGEDHDDEFVFWFDAGDFKMNYFAYRYHREGGGVRFRIADSAYTTSGFRIQHYLNLKYDSISIRLETLPDLFVQDQLDTLSYISIENLKIR